MVAHLTSGSHGLGELVQLDRHAFAAKIRLSRAVLGWSQSELGRRIGLTQRAIHKLEQGQTQPRRSTVRALEEIWRDHDIKFENLAAGGFRVSVPPSALDRPEEALRRHRRRRNVHN
jgi:transcriptional regulator with XRE-family HTH domain